MLARLRNYLLILCLFISGCSSSIHPSEQRLFDHERVQTQSNVSFATMNCHQFAQLWRDSQAEWQIYVPFSTESQQSFIHIECIPSSLGSTLARLTIRATPRNRDQHFTMVYGWSLLLALTQMQDKSLIDATDDANRMLDKLGVKPDGQLPAILSKQGSVIRMPIGTQILEPCQRYSANKVP